MRSRIVSKCILALTRARWLTVFKIMCFRFLAKHSASRRAANDFNHEQTTFHPMHATNICRRAVQRRRPCTLAMYEIRLARSSRTFTACNLHTVQVLCERLSVDLLTPLLLFAAYLLRI